MGLLSIRGCPIIWAIENATCMISKICILYDEIMFRGQNFKGCMIRNLSPSPFLYCISSSFFFFFFALLQYSTIFHLYFLILPYHGHCVKHCLHFQYIGHFSVMTVQSKFISRTIPKNSWPFSVLLALIIFHFAS